MKACQPTVRRRSRAWRNDDPETGEVAEAYVPPMDPVVGTDARCRIEVPGGFGLSSMDALDVDASAQDPQPGDEVLADAIRRELREDAATASLVIAVNVRDGVASLRGTVDGLEDAEGAEDVASRVPGVGASVLTGRDGDRDSSHGRRKHRRAGSATCSASTCPHLPGAGGDWRAAGCCPRRQAQEARMIA
jgi:BON domain